MEWSSPYSWDLPHLQPRRKFIFSFIRSFFHNAFSCYGVKFLFLWSTTSPTSEKVRLFLHRKLLPQCIFLPWSFPHPYLLILYVSTLGESSSSPSPEAPSILHVLAMKSFPHPFLLILFVSTLGESSFTHPIIEAAYILHVLMRLSSTKSPWYLHVSTSLCASEAAFILTMHLRSRQI